VLEDWFRVVVVGRVASEALEGGKIRMSSNIPAASIGM
jgi:hypothetical protein